MAEKIDINKVHDDFNKRVKELQESIDQAGPNESKSNINDLKKEIEQVSHLLPTYQQLSYSEVSMAFFVKEKMSKNLTQLQQIRTLFDQVEKKKVPTRRFKFSKRSEKPKTTQDVLKKPQNGSLNNEEIPSLQDITHKIHKVTESSKQFIQNIQDSILLIPQSESITLKNISNSILYLNSTGPAFLQNITNSCIFAKAHQLRIHDTQNTVILTENIGNGIIEKSSGLVFKSNNEILISDFDHPEMSNRSPSFERKHVGNEDLKLRERLENDELEGLNDLLEVIETVISKSKN